MCKVTSPLARDALGNALTGGLCDPRMGATESGQNCATCGIHHIGCPGHPGHIELDFPVYHPLLFADLFQLVRSACTCCHKIRMGSNRLWTYQAKLQLLEMDDLAGAAELDDKLLASSLLGSSLDDNEDTNTDGTPAENTHVKETLAHMKAIKARATKARTDELEKLDRKYQEFVKNNGGKRVQCSVHAKQRQRAVVLELVKAMSAVKRCENCMEWSPTIRKDGYAKLFSKPIPRKYRKQAVRNKILYGRRTALEEVRWLAERDERRRNRRLQGLGDDEGGGEGSGSDMDVDIDNTLPQNDDSDDEEDGPDGSAKPSESDKYLVPLEAEATLRLLWLHHTELLDFVWSRSSRQLPSVSGSKGEKGGKNGPNVNGWKAFFMRCVLVTPNRFRPEAHVGDSVSDHPQNKNLAKIIESNDAISELARKHTGQVSQANPNHGTGNSLRDIIAKGSPNKGPQGDQAATQIVDAYGRVVQSFLSQSVTLWTQLQNSVNCYIDSAKDPNPLSNTAPAGIRQLLEKKEGMFRMNMMGKRVNYCCRSVISPDPYIGQNEIGIPVKFAKTLHYPTPVNEWNAKHLRTLVERGPDQYPGKSPCSCSCPCPRLHCTATLLCTLPVHVPVLVPMHVPYVR